jgi:hypothetical protein
MRDSGGGERQHVFALFRTQSPSVIACKVAMKTMVRPMSAEGCVPCGALNARAVRVDYLRSGG